MFSWKLFINLSLVLAGILLFLYIADEVVIEQEKMFDNLVVSFFDSITSSGLISTMKVFTFFGSATFLVPLYLVLIAYYIFKRNYLFGTYILIITAGSTVLYSVLKLVFHRKRPIDPKISGVTGFSFPSGHALSAFVLASLLIYITWNSSFKNTSKWIISAFVCLFALLIGVSRIILKVHFPTDVIASFCVGTVWVILSLWVLQVKISKAKANLLVE